MEGKEFMKNMLGGKRMGFDSNGKPEVLMTQSEVDQIKSDLHHEESVHVFLHRNGSRYLVKATTGEKAWGKLEERFELTYNELKHQMVYEKLLEFGANDICSLSFSEPF